MYINGFILSQYNQATRLTSCRIIIVDEIEINGADLSTIEQSEIGPIEQKAVAGK